MMSLVTHQAELKTRGPYATTNHKDALLTSSRFVTSSPAIPMTHSGVSLLTSSSNGQTSASHHHSNDSPFTPAWHMELGENELYSPIRLETPSPLTNSTTDTFGLGNSTSSDRYQTVFNDLVSKIVDVDEDVKGRTNSATADDTHESRSRSSSDIFSLDGSPSYYAGVWANTAAADLSHQRERSTNSLSISLDQGYKSQDSYSWTDSPVGDAPGPFAGKDSPDLFNSFVFTDDLYDVLNDVHAQGDASVEKLRVSPRRLAAFERNYSPDVHQDWSSNGKLAPPKERIFRPISTFEDDKFFNPLRVQTPNSNSSSQTLSWSNPSTPNSAADSAVSSSLENSHLMSRQNLIKSVHRPQQQVNKRNVAGTAQKNDLSVPRPIHGTGAFKIPYQESAVERPDQTVHEKCFHQPSENNNHEKPQFRKNQHDHRLPQNWPFPPHIQQQQNQNIHNLQQQMQNLPQPNLTMPCPPGMPGLNGANLANLGGVTPEMFEYYYDMYHRMALQQAAMQAQAAAAHAQSLPFLSQNQEMVLDLPPPFYGLPQFYHPAFRVPRRTGPSNELHARLEECYDQFKNLERERKKTEAELAMQNPGKKISSANNIVIPRLPSNPSRVDRLVVDSLREHARVITLINKMERLRDETVHNSIHSVMERWIEAIRKVQARRKEEIVNANNRHRNGGQRAQEEKGTDVLALAASIGELTVLTRQARTAMWCALQISGRDRPSDESLQISMDNLENKVNRLRSRENTASMIRREQERLREIDLDAIEASDDV